MYRPEKALSVVEFVTLLALMTSIVALSTDIMLPALDRIGHDLSVADPNDAQLVVSSLFIGFAVGQLLAGPLSDCYGRKPVIYVGYAIFLCGCLMSLLTESFEVMLAGRILQGLGAAAPRIVAMALIRDGYEGRAMARIMSIIMAVFIFVPAVAPALGQGIILLSGWRATFLFLLAVAVVSFLWFALRQPETLAIADRRRFSLPALWQGVVEALGYPATLGYTIAMGLIFGAFLGYLSSAQQIFQGTYATGEMFPAWFASVALCFGVASVVNARLVERLGMRYLTWRAIIGLSFCSIVFLVVTLAYDGVPPFWTFILWLAPTFFFVSIAFANMNAMAMEPVGHMAGLGAALIGCGATLISLPLGWLVGDSYAGGITALIAGFAVLGSGSVLTMWLTEKKQSVA